jgi:metal-responsive CopG/Arc/MetJ family transcriptional regulator
VVSTSLRLPDELARELDEIAAKRRTTRSDAIREAVEQYCAAARKGRTADRIELLHRLVTYEGSGRGDVAENSERYLRELFGARRRRPRPR